MIDTAFSKSLIHQNNSLAIVQMTDCILDFSWHSFEIPLFGFSPHFSVELTLAVEVFLQGCTNGISLLLPLFLVLDFLL